MVNYGKTISDLYNYRDKKGCIEKYITYMLDRTQKIFKYNGLPKSLPKRIIETYLQINGYCVFTDSKHLEIEEDNKMYVFFGGLGGNSQSVYYEPTWCTISNPALNISKRLEFGKDCEIIRNDSMWEGLIPLFERYATALVENDISFDVASKNLRVTSIITAPDTATYDAAVHYLEGVADGEQGVIFDNPFLDGVKVQPYARTENRSLTELIEYQQYLRASWYNEIGLNANYNMKRESLSMAESQMNFDALLPLAENMLEERQEGIKRVNEMFGTDISVEFDSSWELLQKTTEMSVAPEDSKRLENNESEGDENEEKETE